MNEGPYIEFFVPNNLCCTSLIALEPHTSHLLPNPAFCRLSSPWFQKSCVFTGGAPPPPPPPPPLLPPPPPNSPTNSLWLLVPLFTHKPLVVRNSGGGGGEGGRICLGIPTIGGGGGGADSGNWCSRSQVVSRIPKGDRQELPPPPPPRLSEFPNKQGFMGELGTTRGSWGNWGRGGGGELQMTTGSLLCSLGIPTIEGGGGG